ncbi:transposase [Pontibacter sp. Tf4]|uniref:REP-associated tyrosine transposase n=1 Tax=Pontibacter sp. Tf4 TaxID=2761620 RepID=UPI001626C68E|nr:transposase [Pontibacter sp. Tf4]MBB6612787.1 transposase [Pontibacter sp. Tf4]
MSRNYKIRDQSKLYFVSFAVVNWIDVFVRREYKDVVVESLQYCIRHKGLEVYAWCIMPSHVHLIIGSNKEPIEAILRDMKRHTAKAILQMIEEHNQESRKEWMLWMFQRAGSKNPSIEKFQFWQHHNHPIELSSNQMMEQRLDYLHQNPVEAGFVEEPWEYLYSSARDYTGNKGLVDIILIE